MVEVLEDGVGVACCGGGASEESFGGSMRLEFGKSVFETVAVFLGASIFCLFRGSRILSISQSSGIM